MTLYAQWTENTYSITFGEVYNPFEVVIAKADGTIDRRVEISTENLTIENVY